MDGLKGWHKNSNDSCFKCSSRSRTHLFGVAFYYPALLKNSNIKEKTNLFKLAKFGTLMAISRGKEYKLHPIDLFTETSTWSSKTYSLKTYFINIKLILLFRTQFWNQKKELFRHATKVDTAIWLSLWVTLI